MRKTPLINQSLSLYLTTARLSRPSSFLATHTFICLLFVPTAGALICLDTPIQQERKHRGQARQNLANLTGETLSR